MLPYLFVQPFTRLFSKCGMCLFPGLNLGVIVGDRGSPRQSIKDAALNSDFESRCLATIVNGETCALHGEVFLARNPSLRIHTNHANPRTLVEAGNLNRSVQRFFTSSGTFLDTFANSSDVLSGGFGLLPCYAQLPFDPPGVFGGVGGGLLSLRIQYPCLLLHFLELPRKNLQLASINPDRNKPDDSKYEIGSQLKPLYGSSATDKFLVFLSLSGVNLSFPSTTTKITDISYCD
jgi:hypothetical protein